MLLRTLDRLPLAVLVLGSLTLGLAPFVPVPHLVEKLGLLLTGALHRPLDVFDLLFHGAFPLLLTVKLLRMLHLRRSSDAR